MSVTISQTDQVKLARALVNPSKAVRDATCESLQSFLSSMKSMTDLEMLKLWKALYYCMWLSDKAVIQTEIASFLCDLIDSITKKSLILLYIQMFYHTMLREWPLLDQHRLDKFYKLMRFMLRKMFSYLHARQYPIKFTRQCIDMLLSEVLSMTPNGIRFHLIDIYLQELALVSQGDIETNKFLILIQPFFDLLAHSRDEALHERINKKIFSLFLSKYAVENNTKTDGEDSDINSNSDNSIFFSKVKTQSIQSQLFQTAADTNTHDNNRSKIYGLHKMFSIFTGIVFVAVEDMSETETNKENEEEDDNIHVTQLVTPNKPSKKQSPSSSSSSSDKTFVIPVATTTIGKTKSAIVMEAESVNAKTSISKLKRDHVEFVDNNGSNDNDTITNSNSHKKIKKNLETNQKKQHEQSTAGSTPFRINHHHHQQSESLDETFLSEAADEVSISASTEVKIVKPLADFVASARFQKARLGYYFAKGKKGVGYYLDTRYAVNKINKVKESKSSVSHNVKRRVSFGKPQAKDYSSSVKALQNSSPAKIMSESPRPRSALKRQQSNSSSSSNNNNNNNSGGSNNNSNKKNRSPSSK